MIMSFGISTLLLTSFCPTTYPPGHTGALASFCVAYGSCSPGPTVGVIMSGPLLACLAGNPTIAAATSGVSLILSELAKNGLNQIGVGVSLGKDLQYTFSVYDGHGMKDVKVDANYFDYVEISLDGLLKNLKLPDFVSLAGHMTRVVSVPGSGFVSNPLEIDNLRDFAYGMDIFASAQIKLSKLSKGALPDTPTLKLVGATGLVTAQKEGSNGMPKPGLYITLTVNDMFKTIVKEFFDFLLDNFDSLLDSILPSGISLSKIAGAIPSSDGSTVLAFTANSEMTGFYLKMPFPGFLKYLLGSSITIHCKVRYSDGEISCYIGLKEPLWFSIIKDAAVYVAKEAKEFFVDTGNVIACVAVDVWKANNAAGKWTKAAIHKSAEEIANGVVAAGEEVKKFAESKTV
mmetsp:Transcript_5889/g.8247  ORF Transcript_5889/g.8247 Transcript_5889/m.8247 type:complete len:402 (+) Transcript_5889:138-1343(+)